MILFLFACSQDYGIQDVSSTPPVSGPRKECTFSSRAFNDDTRRDNFLVEEGEATEDIVEATLGNAFLLTPEESPSDVQPRGDTELARFTLHATDNTCSRLFVDDLVVQVLMTDESENGWWRSMIEMGVDLVDFATGETLLTVNEGEERVDLYEEGPAIWWWATFPVDLNLPPGSSRTLSLFGDTSLASQGMHDSLMARYGYPTVDDEETAAQLVVNYYSDVIHPH